MEPIEALRGASLKIRRAVDGMAGTERAAGDFGRGAGGDISRGIDVAAEEAVLSHLRDIGFGCTVLGEECGRVEIPGGPGGHVIMDAIDGSANAVRGVPFFCSSLAYAPGDSLSSVSAGVVTNLADGSSYWAASGGGAFSEAGRLSVRTGDPMYRIVCVNMSGAGAGLAARLQPVLENNHARHFGANALEMAMLAAGRVDVMVDLRGRIRIQDIAAGYLLVREAGGVVLDADMKPLDSGLGYDARISFLAASGRDVLEGALAGVPAGADRTS
ncbi:Inositol-1-monophosphatase [Nitrosopumilaceae archaeon]|nr:fructose 1,6-bisphosphatase [Nitrosopumilus sp.]CAI9830945.1 Inositol-1-monophosphatase [Nitrosopumilaceae archaeon]MDA7942219.1 fructose 1,6-bisphosphatase [Nitrosopumilus sp.]MDA7945641.1 fructose 1,6-bisphosphatase [Nitrosopumilus sp.]MDA7955512.1 fructose 1,6-bisphosphatase [Nitrosopumilus sp.]